MLKRGDKMLIILRKKPAVPGRPESGFKNLLIWTMADLTQDTCLAEFDSKNFSHTSMFLVIIALFEKFPVEASG